MRGMQRKAGTFKAAIGDTKVADACDVAINSRNGNRCGLSELPSGVLNIPF
jgi:hypothetical protein